MDNVLSAGHIEDVSGDILELGYCIRRPTTAPSSFLIGTMHGGTFGGKVCDEAKVPIIKRKSWKSIKVYIKYKIGNKRVL